MATERQLADLHLAVSHMTLTNRLSIPVKHRVGRRRSFPSEGRGVTSSSGWVEVGGGRSGQRRDSTTYDVFGEMEDDGYGCRRLHRSTSQPLTSGEQRDVTAFRRRHRTLTGDRLPVGGRRAYRGPDGVVKRPLYRLSRPPTSLMTSERHALPRISIAHSSVDSLVSSPVDSTSTTTSDLSLLLCTTSGGSGGGGAGGGTGSGGRPSRSLSPMSTPGLRSPAHSSSPCATPGTRSARSLSPVTSEPPPIPYTMSSYSCSTHRHVSRSLDALYMSSSASSSSVVHVPRDPLQPRTGSISDVHSGADQSSADDEGSDLAAPIVSRRSRIAWRRKYRVVVMRRRPTPPPIHVHPRTWKSGM